MERINSLSSVITEPLTDSISIDSNINLSRDNYFHYCNNECNIGCLTFRLPKCLIFNNKYCICCGCSLINS